MSGHGDSHPAGMSGSLNRIVVVGASAAGMAAVATLREEGYRGELILIGEESTPGYDRPPLSKQVLLGLTTADDIALHPPAFYQALDIGLHLNARATGLDTVNRVIALNDGQRVEFDGLVIATGLIPRNLAGVEPLEGMFTLRTLQDALALRQQLLEVERVLVVGAGFLGGEVAASARQLGREVTLIDSLELPLLRQLGPEIGRLVSGLHARHGVEFNGGVGVRSLRHASGRVTGAELTDGTTIDAQAVIVAIGSLPATAWLKSSGLDLDDGVMCNEFCEAAEGIFAAGDVANWFNPRFQSRMRLEHRMNATEQGIAVARNMLGAREPFEPIPYFWTDLYDVKVQVYGRIRPDSEMHIVSGAPEQGRFVAAYFMAGHMTAALSWNSPRELRKCHPFIGRELDPGELRLAMS
jgi:3-phenylpropionate/trans-cinnamate dioxygenase ferredoxin reductase subunit